MKINIAKIKLGTGLTAKFTLTETFEDIDFESDKIKFKIPVKVNGEATNAGSMFTILGEAETILNLTCSRCLEEFEYPIKVEFNASFSQPDSLGKDDDDVRIFNGDEIMLDDVIVEALLLELPLKYLCDVDCKGLCSQCGNNLNKTTCNCEKPVDPRFGILADLLKNAEDKPKGV